jgi:hypothetical protein
MESYLELNIDKMFSKYGVKLTGNNRLSKSINLPKESDLKALFGTFYTHTNSNSKKDLINKYVFKRNFFQILDSTSFLPDLKICNLNELNLNFFLDTVLIFYKDKKISCMFPSESNKYLKSQSKNKEFIKHFSKEFQLKNIFLDPEQTFFELKQEITNIIEKRLMELGFMEIANKEFPKVVMKFLDNNLYE